jgi:hypothetical protein
VLGHELGSEVDGPADGRRRIFSLDVDVHTRRPVDALQMEVRRTRWWFEAAQLRMTGPRFTRRPAEDPPPEVGSRRVSLDRNVDHGMDPRHDDRGSVSSNVVGRSSMGGW